MQTAQDDWHAVLQVEWEDIYVLHGFPHLPPPLEQILKVIRLSCFVSLAPRLSLAKENRQGRQENRCSGHSGVGIPERKQKINCRRGILVHHPDKFVMLILDRPLVQKLFCFQDSQGSAADKGRRAKCVICTMAQAIAKEQHPELWRVSWAKGWWVLQESSHSSFSQQNC